MKVFVRAYFLIVLAATFIGQASAQQQSGVHRGPVMAPLDKFTFGGGGEPTTVNAQLTREQCETMKGNWQHFSDPQREEVQDSVSQCLLNFQIDVEG